MASKNLLLIRRLLESINNRPGKLKVENYTVETDFFLYRVILTNRLFYQ